MLKENMIKRSYNITSDKLDSKHWLKFAYKLYNLMFV
jgi:hypothetical protein